MGDVNKKEKRVAIIGSGPGGLACALLLQHAGLDVHVYERKAYPGGRTRVMDSENGGFKHDLGPTFFHYPQVLERIYKICGLELKDEIPMMKLDPMYSLYFQKGQKIHCTPDEAKMKEQLKQFPGGGKKEFEHFMQVNEKKFAAFKPLLEKSCEGLGDIWYTPGILDIIRRVKIHMSVDSDLKGYIKDRDERITFSFQTKYLGMSPDHCPALFTILAYLEYAFGVWHAKGGLGMLTQKTAEICEKRGVTFHYETNVDEILFNGKTATGIRVGEESLDFDAVVNNGDFAFTIPRLVPNELRKAKWNNAYIEDRRFSCSTFMLYLGIDGNYHDKIGHHNIWLPEDYDENLKDIEFRNKLRKNTAFYVQNPCFSDPDSGMAPEGKSVLYILVPVAHQNEEINWEAEREHYIDEVLDHIQESMGLDGLKERIEYQKVMTPDDWENDMNIFNGAVFNMAHNVKQMLHYRPHNRFNHTKNLYLVGGGTHPGSGLATIFESARISARLLLKDLGLDERKVDVPEFESSFA